MNYAEMTDLEINKAVAEFIYPGKEFTAAYSFGFPLGPQVQWIQGYGEFLRKDYCNSWADAGPIILENSIGLIAPFTGFEPEGFARWDAYDPMSQGRAFSHENPLRAAMIVFLMMQEQK